MGLFIDRHDLPDASAADLAAAHLRDLQVQADHGVRFITYWFEEEAGSGFCLVEWPDEESVIAAHREAHGLLPSHVIEVDAAGVRGFFGRLNTHPAGEPYVESAFRAILFTDIADSTRLTQQHGDRVAMRVLREHDSIVRAALARFGGNEVKHTGDGIMGVFDSAYQAVGAARQIQRDVHAREEAEQEPLRVRIGVAAGEPVTDHGDLFGAAVQQAARLCACAEPDAIVASSGVHDLCRGKNIRFSDRGRVALKGFEEPIGHYEVHWSD
ncbi:MAG TPA: nickel-binding protein [Solirubrobacteraceae bacterium]|jgi:class 3 adenylate cyclase|nr:nickel-binding protein [Solirubrobacteraceae bacterium]